MQDKVVMGDQKDGLRGLTRFSDNEGDIIWPAWRAELEQRVAFEFGKIGNQIIEGEVKESDVDLGGVTEKINALINAPIPRTRAQIQTRSEWMEEFVVRSEEGASDEACSIKKTRLAKVEAEAVDVDAAAVVVVVVAAERRTRRDSSTTRRKRSRSSRRSTRS